MFTSFPSGPSFYLPIRINVNAGCRAPGFRSRSPKLTTNRHKIRNELKEGQSGSAATEYFVIVVITL